MKARKITLEIIAGLLVLLWVYAALSKWLDYYTLVRNLKSIPWFGQYAGFISIAIPLSELIVAGLLLFDKSKKVGFVLSAALLVIFTGYIIYILNFAANIPCSCGGVISGMSWTQHLIFNIAYLLLNIIGGLLIYRERIQPETRLS